MNDLADMVEAAMSRYESGHARGLLESPDWLEVRSKAKELSAELEIKGKPVAATRLDREYVRLAEALRGAAAENPPPKIKDDFALWDMSQEFLLTLRSLSRFQGEIERQYRRRQTEEQKTFEDKKRGKRGPKRLSLKQAWRYLTVLQEWAGIQERNQKLLQRDRVRKIQVAEKHKITVQELDAMLGWYAKHRASGLFPNDPRTLSKGELGQWFE